MGSGGVDSRKLGAGGMEKWARRQAEKERKQRVSRVGVIRVSNDVHAVPPLVQKADKQGLTRHK